MKRGSISNRLLDRYAGIAVLSVLAVFNKRRPRPAGFRTIGILASPTIGDTLLTSGAIGDLKRAFPDARLTYFSMPGASWAAAKLIPGIDEIQPIDILNPILTIQTMRKRRLDLVVDFTQWQRITALYSGLSGARHRLGFRSAGQYRHWLYDESVPHSAHLHETENFRALVRSLGIDAECQPVLNPPRNAPGAQTTGIIIFHPWATGDRAFLREWETEKWVELAKSLADNETVFLITTTRAELSRSEDLVRRLKCAQLSAEPLLARDGLLGLCGHIQRSELVVSVNTGIMHLAALLGARTISLNGPTATHRWGPVGPQSCSVEPRGGGGGYLHFGFEFAGNPQDTMRRIHVEDVFAAALELLPRLQQSITAKV
jgi:ADP-heptose:LPS heptosyltransferase